jgi:hypothetical protein
MHEAALKQAAAAIHSLTYCSCYLLSPTGCGHCQALHKPFEAASRALLSTVRLGLVDATKQTTLAEQFRIQGFPTILAFPAGKKTKDNYRKYDGGREKDAIVAYAREMLGLSGMRRLDGKHKQFPDNIVAFFAGTNRTNWAAANLPSVLLFLHTNAPSDEQKAVSQIFQSKVNFGVLSREEKELQRNFRVRSTPGWVVCSPAILTQANRTGQVECGLYDHAKEGASVPALSKFIAEFVKDASAGATDVDQVTVGKKYTLRSVVIDQRLADNQIKTARYTAVHSASGEDLAAVEASQAIRAAQTLSALVVSPTEFHAKCTDTSLGLCLLIFIEPVSWGGLSPEDSRAVGNMNAALLNLVDEIESWNAKNEKRKSMQLSHMLVSSSAPVAARLSDSYSTVLDSSPSGVTLLALIPRRNRFAPFADYSSSSTLDVPLAMEWIEALLRGEKRVHLGKQSGMVERMKQMLPETDVESLMPTYMRSSPNVETSAVEEGTAVPSVPQHEEL